MRGYWSVLRWSLNERKWSTDKCSEVEWSVVGWNVVKCSESLSNRVSNNIRRYIDHMDFAACIAFSFITFFHVLLVPFPIIVCTIISFCILLFNFYIMYFYVYVFLFLCTVYSVLIVLFCLLFSCKCVLYYCHRVSTQLHLTNISNICFNIIRIE